MLKFKSFIANSLSNYWRIIPVITAVLCIAYAAKAAMTPTLGIDIWYHEAGWQVSRVFFPGEIDLKEGDILTEINDLHYADAGRQRGHSLMADLRPGDEVTAVKLTDGGGQPIVLTVYPPSTTYLLASILIALCSLIFCGTAFALATPAPDAVRRLSVLVLCGYGLFIMWGSVSGLQIWYSSPLLHAISWLLLVGVIHMYWLMLPLRRIPASVWWVLYISAAFITVTELLLLAPQGLFYVATLAQIVGAIFLLSVQVGIYHAPAQRAILFGYGIAFLPGFLWVMADVFVGVRNDMFAVTLSVVAVNLWPLFHLYAVHPPASGQRDGRFRYVLVGGSFMVIFLTAFSLLATAVKGISSWDSSASVIVAVGCVLLLVASIWIYDRYRVAINRLLGGDVSQQLRDITLDVVAAHYDRALTAVNVTATLLRGCGIRPCALEVDGVLYPSDAAPLDSWAVLSIPLPDETSPDGRFCLGPKNGRTWYSAAEQRPLTALGQYLYLLAVREALLNAAQEGNARRDQVYNAMVLHEKMAALGEITLGLAHELRNPLQAIITSLETGRDYPEVAEEVIASALGQVARIKALIDSISRFARPSSDTVALVDVHTAIQEALTLCDARIHECGATLETRIPGKLPFVRISPTELTTVLSNLIINACDAMADKEHGRLTLRVEKASGVIIKVMDNGDGINDEDMGRLFTPFFTTKDEGHGFGLYQCYNIIAQRGGRIDVSSTVGQGTSFVVWLPPATE